MRWKQVRIWDRGYLFVFALMEGTWIDCYVRRTINKLEPNRELENEVKSFYIDTMKKLLLMMTCFGTFAVVVRQKNFLLFLLVCMVLGLLAPFWDLRQRQQLRTMELQREYERMLARLLLYMGAGLSIQNAFEKTALALGYERTQSYLCREMRLCLSYLNSGKMETECYYLFGQRCELPEYLRLGGLLAQNAKRGNVQLRVLLENELQDAKDRKRHCIRRQGEQASTKMLGPMMVLLAMVLILIMVPAFGNLG